MAKKTIVNKQKKAKGNNVRQIRTRLGMFQNDLAKAADISVASIRGTESLSRELTETLKARIVRALSKQSEASGEGKLNYSDVFPES